MLISEKGKVMGELSDEKWLWYLELLCDFRQYLQDLSNTLQGQQKLISDMFATVRAFEMEPKLYWKRLENFNVIFPPVICFIRMDHSKCLCCRNDLSLG